MNKPIPNLVSVIIPCFNAEKWLSQAIESILNQTYPYIEIIVIDDGSTDHSLEIIKSYSQKVKWKTGKNQGANQARNLGFALSQGEYIQYLDADDYLFPDKIAKQIKILQTISADFVYSDWCYEYNLTEDSTQKGEVMVCGPKSDFLASLLANDRWSNLAPILFTRSILNLVNWDESLPAAQDRDFLLSLMLKKAQPVYLPGCDSIYRVHQGKTVSTACKLLWFKSHCLVMEKAEKQLSVAGKLSINYQQALAQGYLSIGKEYLYSNYFIPRKFFYYAQILDKIYKFSPDLFLKKKSKLYTIFYQLFGYKITEKISYYFYLHKLLFNFKLSFK